MWNRNAEAPKLPDPKERRVKTNEKKKNKKKMKDLPVELTEPNRTEDWRNEPAWIQHWKRINLKRKKKKPKLP